MTDETLSLETIGVFNGFVRVEIVRYRCYMVICVKTMGHNDFWLLELPILYTDRWSIGSRPTVENSASGEAMAITVFDELTKAQQCYGKINDVLYAIYNKSSWWIMTGKPIWINRKGILSPFIGSKDHFRAEWVIAHDEFFWVLKIQLEPHFPLCFIVNIDEELMWFLNKSDLQLRTVVKGPFTSEACISEKMHP